MTKGEASKGTPTLNFTSKMNLDNISYQEDNVR